MPDIEDIIENLAPFAFVLIWILSAVFGRSKEQKPPTTTRPVFTPVRPKAGSDLPEKSTVSPANQETLDWQQLDHGNPYAEPMYDTQARQVETGESPQEIMQRTLREHAKREARKKKAADRKAAANASSKPQAGKSRQPVNLSHLVSDHAAEMHLEHALTDRSPAAPRAERKSSAAMAALISGMKDKDAIRKAMIMSIVLSEPKSKNTPVPKR